MKLQSWGIQKISIPFVERFQHSLTTRSTTASIVVAVETENGLRGYGECAPREYVTGESIAESVINLQKILTCLPGIQFNDLGEISSYLGQLHTFLPNSDECHLNARCALELALLDAFGKENRISIANLLGKPAREEAFYSGVVSGENPKKVEKILAKMKAIGFRQIKLKVGQNIKTDLKNIDLIRTILGDDVEIRVDANAAWQLPEAIEHIKILCQNDVRMIEQPLPADHRDDYPELVKAVADEAHIIIDESVCSIADAKWFIENRGAGGFNLKIAKLGGLLNSLKIYRMARENGLHCQLGCHVGETSILTAAGMIFTSLAKSLTAVEGAYGHHLLTFDVIDIPLQFGIGGLVNVNKLLMAPGLGIDINPETLIACS